MGGTLVSAAVRSLIVGILLLVAEAIVRAHYEIVPIGEPYNIPVIAIVFGLLISYSRSWIAAALLGGFLWMAYAIQLFSISNYGYFITPIKLWLLFEKFLEVLISGKDAARTMGTTFFAIALASLGLASLFVARKNITRKNHWVSVLTIAVVIFYPVKQTINHSNTLGRLPVMYHSTIKSSFYTWGYFAARVVPEEVFGLSRVRPFASDAPVQLSGGEAHNIVLIMGESLSSKYMSVFGFSEPTTPWLEAQSQQKNRFLAEGYSGGLFTDVSLPFFFNAIPKPNGLKQIGSGETNIFRLAKENGYDTHFYSSQPNYGLSLMSMLGKGWIDHYDDAFSMTNNSYKGVLDGELLTWFNTVDLNKKNLIVLHQTGSHMPYAERTPDDYKPFGTDSDYAEYMNSVRYTDDLIKQVQTRLEQQAGEDWLLIMTSDHGQYVTKTTAGHGNFHHESNYKVPIYISSDKRSNIDLAKAALGGCERVFQIQLSHFLTEMLGFSYPTSPNCAKGYVAGSRLTGDNGFLKVDNSEEKESVIVYE
jgi:glucan phosphoethanolaminetransferase (alkaline phosphatase superfamily)